MKRTLASGNLEVSKMGYALKCRNKRQNLMNLYVVLSTGEIYSRRNYFYPHGGEDGVAAWGRMEGYRKLFVKLAFKLVFSRRVGIECAEIVLGEIRAGWEDKRVWGRCKDLKLNHN